MIKRTYSTIAVALLGLVLAGGSATPALAYSCESQFASADRLIAEAQALIKQDMDARIKAMVAEAKGINDAAKLSHREASQRHTGADGKYMHGDAVRKGRWSQSLAKQAIFLLSGEPR